MVNADTDGHLAYVGLGSNLGRRKMNIAAALNALEATRDVCITATSGLYETAPVGGPADQPPYINAVVSIRTALSAHRFLDLCLHIEESLGRKRTIRWGPRTLDLDILAFDDLILSSDRLTIPHPRLHERAFVLEPLVEIAPEFVHPGLDRTARDLLAALSDPAGHSES